MQDSGHFHHILKKPGQHTQTKIILVTFKRQKRPVGQRSQIFPYKPKNFCRHCFSHLQSLGHEKMCPSGQQSWDSLRPGWKGSIQPCCCRADLSSILSFKPRGPQPKCLCGLQLQQYLPRETEQSIKQRGTKIQDLMPRIYFSLPRKAEDMGQVLQHQWWLLGVETPSHHPLGTESTHSTHLPPSHPNPGMGISPTHTLWSSFIQPVPPSTVRK